MKKLLFTTFIVTMFLTTTAQSLNFSSDEIAQNHTELLSKMIAKIQPELSEVNRKRIAASLYKTIQTHKVNPRLMIAIIGTESDFVNSKISTTGDLSLAQINTKVWNKEFTRLGLAPLDAKLLKTDEAYALNKMAIILNIIKARHEKNDKNWFARYHSHTKKYKKIYSAKVDKRMRMIASIN